MESCLFGFFPITGVGSLHQHEGYVAHKDCAKSHVVAVLSKKERKAVTEASFCYFAVMSGLSYNSLDGLAQTFRGVVPFMFPESSDDFQNFSTTSFGRTKATAIINKVLYDAAFEEVSSILHYLITRLSLSESSYS